MLPYLIAGAIGYGIAKLLEEDKTPKYADGGLVAKIGDKVYFFNGIRNGEIYVQKAIVEEIDTDYFGNKIYGIVYGNGTRQFIQDKLVFSTEDKAKEYSIKQKNKWLDYTNNKFEEDKAPKYVDGGSILLAPNGKPSNLTPEQYKLVRTKAFKDWFGDWENDPENASKVVDENGEPLVVYHGSRSEFTVFDIDKSGDSNTTAKVGFWFTPIKNFAENFASSIWYGKSEKEIIYSVFLSVKNPKIYETEIIDEEQKQELRLKIKELQNKSKEIQKRWVTGNWDYQDRMVLEYSEKGLINEENYEYYSKLTNKSKDAINDGILIAEINKKKKNIENKLYGVNYSDSYEKFRADIYEQEGKSSYDANVGGLGMGLSDPSGTIKKYINSLTDNRNDGIIIKNTRFDKSKAGGLNDQYVAFEPNQIKLEDGTNTTFDGNNPDIRFNDGGVLPDNIFDYLKEKGFEPLGNGLRSKSNCTIKMDFSNVLYQAQNDNRVWISPIEYSDYKKAFTILEFHCRDKNKGIGTAVLEEIIRGADLFGYTIFIEPTSMKKYRGETDINTDDLKRWYSKFDFKPINNNYSNYVWLRSPKNPDIS